MPIPVPSGPVHASRTRVQAGAPAIRLPRPFQQRFSDRRRASFYRELHLLVEAGVDPGTAFDVLLNAATQASMKDLYGNVRRHLAQGRTMAGAFAAEGRFSIYEQQSVQVGEETGRIAEVLQELAAHFDARVELRRTFTGAIAYPAFVLFISGGVVVFMLRVVVPMFADVFKRSGAELPALTKFVMRLAGIAGPLTSGGLVLAAMVVLVHQFFSTDPRVARWKAWASVRLPLIGPIYKRTQFARFYRAMAAMLAAQLPLDRALSLATELVALHDLRMALVDVRERVLKGAHLHEAFAHHQQFEPKDVAMITVAEEVRQLDRMFLRLAEERTADVKHRTAMMGKVLEPAMIVFIAVFVGMVLVAMYLPMFKLSTAF